MQNYASTDRQSSSTTSSRSLTNGDGSTGLLTTRTIAKGAHVLVVILSSHAMPVILFA